MEHDHTSTRKGISHTTMMLICCLVPIVAIILLSFMDVGSTYLNYLLVLMCPIMMFMMMIMNRHNHQDEYYT